MAEPSTDDEVDVETSPKTKDDKWLRYERDVVAELNSMDPKADVLHDQRIRGYYSKTIRQIDGLANGTFVGMPMMVVAECKRYTKKIGIGKVDEFIGKLNDLGAGYGLLYAYSGATKNAHARAEGSLTPRVMIKELIPTAPPTLPLGVYMERGLKLGDCGNANCIGGEVSWGDWPQESGETVKAGPCPNCGTWSFQCSSCGETTAFFTDDDNCGACWREYKRVWNQDHSEVVDIVAGAPTE